MLTLVIGFVFVFYFLYKCSITRDSFYLFLTLITFLLTIILGWILPTDFVYKQKSYNIKFIDNRGYFIENNQTFTFKTEKDSLVRYAGWIIEQKQTENIKTPKIVVTYREYTDKWINYFGDKADETTAIIYIPKPCK